MLMRTPVRAFGGGHHHHHEEHEYVHQKSRHVKYEIPTEHDIDAIQAKDPIMNERLMAWIAGIWPVDRDHTLDNTNTNKYSMYYYFRNYGL